MPADIQLWHPDYLGSAKGKLQHRYVNTVGSSVTESAWADDGRAIADVYELIFTVSGTVSATIDCKLGGTKNPYHDTGSGRSVVADGSTWNKNLIPGVNLKVSGSVVTGHTARVAVSNYLEDNGSYTAFFGYGVVQAGSASTGQRVAAKNVGDATSSSTVVYFLPNSYWYGTNAELFIKKIAPHTSPTRHKLASAATKAITFSDWKDAGGGKKSADIYIGGQKCVEDAIFDGTSIYQYGSGNGYIDGTDLLAGQYIILVDTTSDPSSITPTLKITADYTYGQFAADVSGSPGTYSNQDLTLTQSGQPSGTILASGSAYFWHKWVLPDGATAGDLRKNLIRVRGLTV